MYDSTGNKTHHHHFRREIQHRRRSWCCPFTNLPLSPENTTTHSTKLSQKPEITQITSSKSPTSFVGRILSPGRVSPIESIQETTISNSDPDPLPSTNNVQTNAKGFLSRSLNKEESGLVIFYARLNLKGKNGDSVILEVNSKVLSGSSSVFADLIADYRRGSSHSDSSLCRIEVPDVDNLNVFRETIELMFVDDITKRLINIGVYKSIDILEVSAGINFTKGVLSCLKYLEAVPWSEEEEEKLRTLFTKFRFDNTRTRDIFSRLYSQEAVDSLQTLAKQLLWSITSCCDANARNELKSLVKGLLCKSSVYEKNYPDLTKDDVYAVCHSCLQKLVSLFEEENVKNVTGNRSLIELVSNQVDNINWLLEILLDWQMAEEFVDIWTDQKELLRVHEKSSPMVRYEISRVSAMLFIAIGTRKLHCRGKTRVGFVQSWLGPMLVDFSWLQRCRKGLDMRALEEAMGQTLLTLPLKHQYMLFMEWFCFFSKYGTECPNLSRAFQIWWRRSFLKGSESRDVGSR